MGDEESQKLPDNKGTVQSSFEMELSGETHIIVKHQRHFPLQGSLANLPGNRSDVQFNISAQSDTNTSVVSDRQNAGQQSERYAPSTSNSQSDVDFVNSLFDSVTSLPQSGMNSGDTNDVTSVNDVPAGNSEAYRQLSPYSAIQRFNVEENNVTTPTFGSETTIPETSDQPTTPGLELASQPGPSRSEAITPVLSKGQLLASEVKRKARNLGQVSLESNLQVYELPMTQKHVDPAKRIRRLVSSPIENTRCTKSVIMVGISGSGKSLMINNLINFIYGVEYKDNFRFKLILEVNEESEREQRGTTAMTSWVTAYDLIWEEGFPMEYNLTLIDTPGFADDKGVDYDEIIVERIKNMFHSKNTLPMQYLDAIGFVIPASTTRLTGEQKYVFDQVLNIFGNDLKNNVTVLCTFADAQKPPAIETVRKDGIQFASFFKFNNSAVFAPNDDENQDETEYAWKFGHKNVIKFLQALETLNSQKLDVTNAVLDKRESLKLLLMNLQPQIDIGMKSLQDIEAMTDDIFTINGTLLQNQNYKVKKTVNIQHTEIVNNYITNCPKCMETCHNPCQIAGDVKERCWAMSDDGNCRICSDKCPWDVHKNGDRIYTYESEETVETIQEMLDKYNISIQAKDAKQQLLENILEEYRVLKTKMMEDIVNAAEASRQLDKMALRNNYLTNVDYIELLIKTERNNSRPYKQQRLQQLQVMLGMAKTLRSAKTNPGSLTNHMSEYETTVHGRISQLNSEMQGGRPISGHDSLKRQNPLTKARKTVENRLQKLTMLWK